VSSYKSFFNPTNVLVMAALLALILFRHSLFPEASESTEVKKLMGKMDAVIDDMQTGAVEPLQTTGPMDEKKPAKTAVDVAQDEGEAGSALIGETERQPVISESDAQATLTLWQTARRAAWDGNSDAAVENYRALIKLQPDNYDAYGEMGNVLLQQGNSEDAVEAYSQATLLLAKSGFPQAAWHVMNIVAKMDQERADKLHQTLYGTPPPASQ
jgi:Flp pilus assembly protein TadD